MAKKRNHLDELEQYQRQQYLPHTHHIQNGELPFAARQMMKQGIKKKLYQFFIFIPLSLAAVIGLRKRLGLDQETVRWLVLLWLCVLVLVFVLIVLSERSKARKTAAQKKKRK